MYFSNRLQKISSSQSIFKETTQQYQEAIRASRYDHELAYNHKHEKGKNKKRRRNILYFNVIFCKSVATRVGKCFLEIVDKNFTEDHLYCKVFNQKTLKVFYSCMPNMKQLIMAHNRKMSDTQDKERRMCDCKK